LERIGHRGARLEFPENTLAAFQRAFERGADATELDVHATRDGVVVVHHDPESALLGGRAIAAATWNDVSRVDLGGGLGIPRLSDVLDATPPGSTVYVEIKGLGIEAAVVGAIRRSSARCAVHSFDHDAIARVRGIAPEIPRGILFDQPAPPADVVRVMQATGARDVWPHWRLIDPALVDAVHSAGGRVIAWTVNEADTARRLASLGVDGLCGDDVRLLPHE